MAHSTAAQFAFQRVSILDTRPNREDTSKFSLLDSIEQWSNLPIGSGHAVGKRGLFGPRRMHITVVRGIGPKFLIDLGENLFQRGPL